MDFGIIKPNIGRYLATDPIGFSGEDSNLYAFVYNNPVVFLDPLGLQCREVRLIVHAIHGNENSSNTHTFANAAEHLANQYAASKNKDEKARGVEDIEIIKEQVRTGREIVDLINKQAANSIISFDVIFPFEYVWDSHFKRSHAARAFWLGEKTIPYVDS